MADVRFSRNLQSGIDGPWDARYIAAAATTPILDESGLIGGISIGETAAGAITVYDNYLYGDATTQITVTQPDEEVDTFRYTWNDTGTSPGWTATTMPAGTIVTFASQNLSAGNNGTFTVTASGAKYIEVTNENGVAEANKATGTGTIRLGSAALTTVAVLKASIGENFHLPRAVRLVNGLTLVVAAASKLTVFYRS